MHRRVAGFMMLVGVARADVLPLQDRVTDHRIGLSLMNLQSFMEGDGVQEFLDAMRRNWEEEMMEEAVSD